MLTISSKVPYFTRTGHWEEFDFIREGN